MNFLLNICSIITIVMICVHNYRTSKQCEARLKSLSDLQIRLEDELQKRKRCSF